MDNKFFLVWEDNPDTPITAQNLSKSIDKYSDDDRMLFWDFNDNYLKLKANSKATISVPITNGMFSFENTMSSHNGRFNPTSADNVVYRNETTVENSKSIALESGTTNFITNPSFESTVGNFVSGWTKVENGLSTVVNDPASFYGSNCLKIKVNNSGSIVSLFQTAQTLGVDDTVASVSFYYKASNPIRLLIIGDPSGTQKFWRPFGVNNNVWETLETTATIVVPASTEWTRYEVVGIKTETIKSIQLKFSSDTPGAEYFLDAVQLENKEYCSSFTLSTRETGKVIYPKELISLDEGSVDLIVQPKHLNISNINTIFVAPTVSYDAIKLKLDRSLGQNLLIFSIYDTYSSSVIQASIDLEESENFINNYIRIICNWKKSTGISIYAKYVGTDQAIKVSQNPTPFTPIQQSELLGFHLGAKHSAGTANEIFEGLLDKIKINNYITSNTDITDNIDEYIVANENTYRLFENTNNDLIIDASLLDTGTSLLPNRNYYLWISELSGFDSCEVLLSLSDVVPNGKNVNTSRILGGFKTTDTGLVDERTIWDLVSKYKNLLVERFVTYNPATKIVTMEMYNSMIDSLLTINAPIISNRENVFNALNTYNGANVFNGNVTVTSKTEIDQIKIENNVISGLDSDVIVTNLTTRNISLLSSPSGKVYIDKLNFKDNSISVENNYHLTITTPTGTSSKIILNAASGANTVESQSDVHIINNKILKFNSQYRQYINLGADATLGIGTQTNTEYFRTNKYFAWYKGGVHSDTQLNSGSADLALAILTDGDVASSLVSTTSRFYAGRIHNAIYNDLAECWVRDTKFNIDYNMVAVQTKTGIRPSACRAEKAVVGIVSDSYGFLLNDKDFDPDLKKSSKAPICISGRAKVMVIGKNIEIGDEVVSYVDGKAIKASWFEKIFKRDRIIGQIDSYVFDDIYWIKVK